MRKLLSVFAVSSSLLLINGCSDPNGPSSQDSILNIIYTRFDFSGNEQPRAILADSNGRTIRDIGLGVIRPLGKDRFLVLIGDSVTETSRLYTADKRGNLLKPITAPQELYWVSFVGSANGERVAIGLRESGIRSIIVMDADGSDRVTITDHWAHETVFALSPDGNRIAFMREIDGVYELCLSNTDGTGLQVLETLARTAPDGYSGVQWAGNSLVYDNDDMIKHYDLVTNTATAIGEGVLPRLSPDGETIVFTSGPGADLLLTRDRGVTFENLTNTPTRPEAYAEFSPDRSKLLFIHWQGDYDHVPGTMGMVNLTTGEVTDQVATPVLYGYWVK